MQVTDPRAESRPAPEGAQVNFLIGLSDGLRVPIAVCVALQPFVPERLSLTYLLPLVSFMGAIVMGLVRFLGEKDELAHNNVHRQQDAAGAGPKAWARLDIDGHTLQDFQGQLEAEQQQWHRERSEHGLEWGQQGAHRGALYLALGYASGSLFTGLPVFFVKDMPGGPALLTWAFLACIVFALYRLQWSGRRPYAYLIKTALLFGIALFPLYFS